MHLKRVPLALALAALAPFSSPAQSATTFPPHTIPDTQLRVLPKSANGRAYQLHIGLPASYTKETTKRYPVLFVTDGYWDFETIHCSYNNLVYDRVVPECILVGLGYAGENLDYGALRGWELSPVALGNDPATSGHAAEFLQTLERDIIPFVEREYRANPHYRVLAGSSLGGLFTLYAMYTKPELFQGYIAASPAAVVGNDWLAGYEEAFAKSGRAIKGRLFMTGAENEWPSFLAGIKRFNDRLATRHYPGFTYSFRLIDGERHAGTKAESYVRGMRFTLEPLAPETGPAADTH